MSQENVAALEKFEGRAVLIEFFIEHEQALAALGLAD